MDVILSVLTLLGGLALFLYGMDVMGDSLKKLAGGKLENILSKLSSNRFKGFLLGFLVTAVIQSSSATTVMLVGFVNSGIMKLGQTIGVILGANVGTTVTSWLLSLSGIDGSAAAWLQLLKPSSFTPVLMVVGVVMLMVCKSDKKKNIASILVGFSVLMFGMETMSAAMEPLKDSSTFRNMLIMFENPILAILVGTVLTAIIQSSSASVGILQALALSCPISYSVAIPIILGQNIGTTITPILSSITGNTESKRVATACLYIKLIGVAVVYSIFCVLNNIFHFSVMGENSYVTVTSIAIIHTSFNFISTAILIPFTKLIEKLTVKTVKSKKVETVSEFGVLDDRFLSIPSFAVQKCREMVCEMSEKAKLAVNGASSLITSYNKSVADEIIASENHIDIYEDKISTYLIKIAKTELSANDSKTVTELLQCISDIERISDYAAMISGSVNEVNRNHYSFSNAARHELKVIAAAVDEILDMTHSSLLVSDLELARHVEPLRQVVDRLIVKIKTNHVVRLQNDQCSVETGIILSELLNDYSRIAGHCSNVALCLLESAHGSMEMHGYVSSIKKSDEDTFFSEMYKEYKQKYALQIEG